MVVLSWKTGLATQTNPQHWYRIFDPPTTKSHLFKLLQHLPLYNRNFWALDQYLLWTIQYLFALSCKLPLLTYCTVSYFICSLLLCESASSICLSLWCWISLMKDNKGYFYSSQWFYTFIKYWASFSPTLTHKPAGFYFIYIWGIAVNVFLQW